MMRNGTSTSFSALKQIDAGLLNVGYAEAGKSDGPAVVLLHGWPYDIHSFVDVAPLLSAQGYRVIVPYLRGYGTTRFLSSTTPRLGYTRYVAQGGDQGAAVTDAMARQAPNGLVGIHLNLLSAFPTEVLAAVFGGEFAQGLFKRVAVAVVASRAEKERAALDAVAALFMRGYIVEMPEHPQTIGYALTDTPVGLAAWMLDHDADSYEKISHAFLEGQPSGGLTRDRIVDNITLYWLTNTATSSARLYWESRQATARAAGQKPPELSLPVAFTVFPGEIFQAPRSWAEKVYPNLIYFNEVDKGGHFAAWEEPELFASELRAAFRSLR